MKHYQEEMHAKDILREAWFEALDKAEFKRVKRSRKRNARCIRYLIRWQAKKDQALLLL